MFDAEKFGEAMGAAIRDAVAPLIKRIEELEARKPEKGADGAKGADGKDGANGKDATIDMEAVFARIDAAVKAIPVPKDGKDGIDGAVGPRGEKGDPGQSIKGEKGDPGESIKGEKGDPGESIKGEKGEPGKDGVGLAGAMIDRDGALTITKSNGEAVKLGIVVGKDGIDGKDGLSVESLEREYDPQTHEVVERWSLGGRTKEMRYPAGGIRAGGYWREGTKAVAGEAWTQGGSLWIAVKDTTEKPDAKSENWFLAARAGRDGERGIAGKDGSPPAPISLRARA